MSDTTRNKGVSLAKGPIALIGLALLAAGILGYLIGDNHSFKTSNFPDGTANGSKVLGFEVNGWTDLLLAGSGLLLLLAAPLHWGAKTMGIIVGLILGAASVIALVDKKDVLGLAAANGPTKLLLGAASAALLIFSLLPRVGKKDHDRDRDRDRDVVAAPRRERVVEREVAPVQTETVSRERVVDRDRVGHDRVDHDRVDHDHPVGEREVLRDDTGAERTERIAPDPGDERPLR
jgi:hypothetical protein